VPASGLQAGGQDDNMRYTAIAALFPVRIWPGRPACLALQIVAAVVLGVLAARTQSASYELFTAAGLPRDGGMAELLDEAVGPEPS
jgi:hypothetical protein